jgi:hypothetical protein
METKVSLIIQNHLNNVMLHYDVMFEVDINEEIFQDFQEQAKECLRFVKYLVHMFPDTNVKIDVEAVYKQFKLGEK